MAILVTNGRGRDRGTMTQAIQASKIEEVGELVDLFGLAQTFEPDFFPEWRSQLPDLSDPEQQALMEMKEEYRRLSLYANLEPIVKMVIVGPLLKMAGFYRPPFRVKAEKRVELATEDEGVIVRGLLDVLVMHDRFWTVLIEAKRVQYSLDAGIPQALFYMLGDPNPNKPIFGFITNGPDFQFLKLVREDRPQFSLSDRFYMDSSRDDLHQVLKILKKLGALVQG
ncbi:MAG: restriction endonuclease subunit R [Cyanobacteria bacterium J06636_16]